MTVGFVQAGKASGSVNPIRPDKLQNTNRVVSFIFHFQRAAKDHKYTHFYLIVTLRSSPFFVTNTLLTVDHNGKL